MVHLSLDYRFPCKTNELGLTMWSFTDFSVVPTTNTIYYIDLGVILYLFCAATVAANLMSRISPNQDNNT